MSYQYSQEAKERVRKLGQSDIIDFIGEVLPFGARYSALCLKFLGSE